MQIDHALALARRLMTEHQLHGWTVVADRAKTRAGVCRFATRQIGLSRPLTELHSEEEVRDTILHEIAHALVGPDHGHDRVWRAKAREIGSSGERCLSSAAPLVRGAWEGTCSAGHRSTRHKAPTRVMTCGRCSRRFDVRHLIRWTYNGAVVPMPDAYAAQLRQLLGASAAVAGGAVRKADVRGATGAVSAMTRPLAVGDRVVVIDGMFDGMAGELEFVGALRCQVRLDDDGELASVALAHLERDSVPQASESAADVAEVAEVGRGEWTA